MGVGIASQQYSLIEHESSVPDRGCASEQRQCHSRKHRLNEEDEKGAEKNCNCKYDQHFMPLFIQPKEHIASYRLESKSHDISLDSIVMDYTMSVCSNEP